MLLTHRRPYCDIFHRILDPLFIAAMLAASAVSNLQGSVIRISSGTINVISADNSTKLSEYKKENGFDGFVRWWYLESGNHLKSITLRVILIYRSKISGHIK